MAYMILVKGDVENALAVTAAHGFKANPLRQISGDTSLRIADRDAHSKLVAWMNEPPYAPPYPDGTLLFFRAD